MAKIIPHLWFEKGAEEATRLYASLIPDSHVDHVAALPADSPSGPAGSVQMVLFTLAGQPFQAINGGPLDAFNHAVSFVIQCEDQAEIDRLWEKLGEGGSYEQCGWLRDRWGVSWQIVPRRLGELMGGSDRAAAKRVQEAFLKMRKFDIAALERAAAGEHGPE